VQGTFENLIIGPAISIPRLDMKQQTLKDILDKDLVVTAYITDVNHPVFKQFSDATEEQKPVAVFITVQYKYFYD
jgi:hypothetical protein